MSGAGKSTVLEELRRRGYHTVDTDYRDWEQAGLWDASRMAELLARHPDVVVAGTAENQGEFYDRFQHVVLLSVPASVILERVRQRTNNPYGKSSEQQAEILGYVETVEPLLRRGATLELDGRAPVDDLASVIESLVRMQEP
jgi:shikimate kinase